MNIRRTRKASAMPAPDSTQPYQEAQAYKALIGLIGAEVPDTPDWRIEHAEKLEAQAREWRTLANVDQAPRWATLAAALLAQKAEYKADDLRHDEARRLTRERVSEVHAALAALPDQVPADPEEARDVNRTATALWAELEDTEDRANTPDCYDCGRQWADCRCEGPQT